jgi:hypothetical protein
MRRKYPVRFGGGPGEKAAMTSLAVYPTSVRRESGMEECGNTSGIQVPDEPLELSVVDHSTA